MIEYNLYVGKKGLLNYQFTELYESILDAELDAQEISEMDAKEYGYPLKDCRWLAVETDLDDISKKDLVGSRYM